MKTSHLEQAGNRISTFPSEVHLVSASPLLQAMPADTPAPLSKRGQKRWRSSVSHQASMSSRSTVSWENHHTTKELEFLEKGFRSSVVGVLLMKRYEVSGAVHVLTIWLCSHRLEVRLIHKSVSLMSKKMDIPV